MAIFARIILISFFVCTCLLKHTLSSPLLPPAELEDEDYNEIDFEDQTPIEKFALLTRDDDADEEDDDFGDDWRDYEVDDNEDDEDNEESDINRSIKEPPFYRGEEDDVLDDDDTGDEEDISPEDINEEDGEEDTDDVDDYY